MQYSKNSQTNSGIAKQMSFESGFECDYYRSTSFLLWKLVPAAAGIIAKSRLSMLRVKSCYF